MSVPKSRVLILSSDRKTNELRPKSARVSQACLICRKKKRKCNGAIPCSFCEKYSFQCSYSDKKFSDITEEDIVALKKHNILEDESDGSPPTSKKARTESSDFDYQNIVEMLFSKKVLEKIKDNNPDKDSRRQYMIKLLENNIDQEKMILNLNLFKEVNGASLPPRYIALKLILKSWNFAGVLFRFYHRPTLIKILDSLYESNGYPKTNEESQAISLVYAVLAVGALFSKDDFDESDKTNREFCHDEGLRFFNKARDLINFKDINGIYAMQTLFMMTMFLQCSANLKQCYYYIGIAKRLALREKLHRRSSLTGPTMIEDETKKRLFWCIYKVDIYLNCILGLPSSMSENNVDQEFPIDVDDEKITAVSSRSDFTSILNNPASGISSCGMNNEHTKLILVMLRIHESLYALDLKILSVREEYMVQFEHALQSWYDNLPVELKREHIYETALERDHYLKPSKLLYLDFLLTKLILYKPFFHFINIDTPGLSELRSRLTFQISMAHNCIEISKEIISLALEMINADVINGTYWFSIHTIFYSVACLTAYRYHLHQRKFQGSGDTFKDNKELASVEKYYQLGYEVLVKLKANSMASERIYNVLSSIFKEFNENMLDLSRQVIVSLTRVNVSTTAAVGPSASTSNASVAVVDNAANVTNAANGTLGANGPHVTTDFDVQLNSDIPLYFTPGAQIIDDNALLAVSASGPNVLSIVNNGSTSLDAKNGDFHFSDLLFDPQSSLDKLLEDLGIQFDL
ncbi:hypothetical protein DAKH74_015590 [Maudiozyma humilis]|uniref:Zn(2)-C6 fungal-type domain-containing protein n=1 Tax=Maudiozyma humilis TaxID=51915 RepID=A0AAV5RWD8_MAUHU|nr:hypothetical protein DAKH74_015590 [Kazachstania humilis]